MNQKRRGVSSWHKSSGSTFTNHPVFSIILAGLAFFMIFLVASWGLRSGAREEATGKNQWEATRSNFDAQDRNGVK
ncbi:MAG: hypothetical protein CVU57_20030 [Deltaproteobacteria bacterium HGW-Deltaproteobacteria-15]|jgi:hypothetical protein|nr:MAG: hypothetical protein CVU57_20030 [Deltaproteobacteria bacterium HGW-Deltaproteobacteria-15]